MLGWQCACYTTPNHTHQTFHTLFPIGVMTLGVLDLLSLDWGRSGNGGGGGGGGGGESGESISFFLVQHKPEGCSIMFL